MSPPSVCDADADGGCGCGGGGGGGGGGYHVYVMAVVVVVVVMRFFPFRLSPNSTGKARNICSIRKPLVIVDWESPKVRSVIIEKNLFTYDYVAKRVCAGQN